MVQISIVSGKGSGKSCALSKFPAVIGRDSGADIVLDDDGVWDKHCEILYVPCDGYYIASVDPATVILNDKPVQKSRLRNGDLLVIGNARLRFWLSEVKPKSFCLSELSVWFSIVALFIIQLCLIYWIIRFTG